MLFKAVLLNLAGRRQSVTESIKQRIVPVRRKIKVREFLNGIFFWQSPTQNPSSRKSLLKYDTFSATNTVPLPSDGTKINVYVVPQHQYV
jgi:hypothetical protein